MQSKVEICGVNTASLTVIPANEITDLLRQAHDGNAAARKNSSVEISVWYSRSSSASTDAASR